MAITAADIQNVSFSIDRKGYDVDEVDVFLERVADEVEAMTAHIAELEASGASVSDETVAMPAVPVAEDAEEGEEVDVSAYQAQIAELEAKVAELEEQLAEKTANDAAISQALIVAQRSADDVIAKARSEASNIVKDADDEADRIIGKAEADRLKIIESIRQLETDRTEVRSEYRDMLANFMADAQKKLADIDGDARRAAANAQVRNDMGAANYAPSMAGATGAQPATSNPVDPSATIAAPAPSVSGFIDKDLSGFGAADDDFEFDVD